MKLNTIGGREDWVARHPDVDPKLNLIDKKIAAIRCTAIFGIQPESDKYFMLAHLKSWSRRVSACNSSMPFARMHVDLHYKV